jgi:Flp pilus assembly pilin Flp
MPTPLLARTPCEGRSFFRDETGQDIVEYSLILAFIALAGAAAYIGMSASTQGLWSVVNSRLASANQSGS